MLATIADAHREWHLNAGVPIGHLPCPWDACQPYDDYYEDYDAVAIMCGHCKQHHYGDRAEVLASIRSHSVKAVRA